MLAENGSPDLSNDPQLWSRPVHNDRFALVARTS
jgi:hypothetical protein